MNRLEIKLWQQKAPIFIIRAFAWCEPGSNRRHKDFQSFALPTELPHQSYFQSFPFGVANIADLFILQKKSPL